MIGYKGHDLMMQFIELHHETGFLMELYIFKSFHVRRVLRKKLSHDRTSKTHVDQGEGGSDRESVINVVLKNSLDSQQRLQ